MERVRIFTLGAFCILWSILLTSCGSKTDSNQSENSAAFDSVKSAAYSGYTAIGITHSVKDFDDWLTVYNQYSDPSARLSIFTNPDDPKLVTVIQLTKSHAEAKNALTSELVKKAMSEAGVTSEPVVAFYDIKYMATGSSDKLYRLGVSHNVEDFEKWKRVFDEDEPIRAKANLELRAISTEADEPLHVSTLFATDNLDKAKEVINSDELKRRMKEAGVTSQPVFTVLKVPSRR